MDKLDSKRIENILALTPVQEGILFHYLKNPGSNYYFEQVSLDISGEMDVPHFEKAWNTVIKTNEMLRTVFRWEKLEKPSQIILKEHHCQVSFYDLSDKDNSQKKAVFKEIKKKDRCEPFDLHQVPFRVILCKLDENKHQVVISNHHILYDGWSTGIILKELFKAYHESCNGGPSIKPHVKIPFKEFITWIQSQDRNKQKEFWGEYLSGFETPTALSIKRRIKGATRAEDYSIILEEDIPGKLNTFVKNHRVTLASVFYSAWGILLQKYCDSEDIIFGTTVSGRSAGVKGIESMVGLFINTLPLRVQSAPSVKIIDIVSGVQNALQVREEFESTPLPDIGSYSTMGGSGLLFDTIMAIENYPLDNRLLPEDSLLSVHSYSITEMTHYDLTVGIMPFNEIEVKFSFKQELFEKETIKNLAGHFKGIIQNLIENPEMALSQLEIISSEEKSRVLYEFNRTVTEYPKNKTIHELFAEQVKKTPDNIALVGAALSVRPVCLTYRQLNEQSTRLAHLLIEKGILADKIVGIMVERSVEMIIGIFSILKAGGAYLPLDPAYPEERIEYMLKDCNAKIIVGNRHACSEELNCQLSIVNWELLMSESEPSFHHSSFIVHHSSRLAYVIYTSGSTGKPKGVMIEHASAVNLLFAMQDEYPFTPADTYLLKTSYIFDVSVTELFGWAMGGGRLAILEKNGEKDPQVISEWIEWHHVTHINFVPSMFNAFASQLEGENINRLSSLKYIFLAGEALLSEFVKKFHSLNTTVKLENIYGPTESSVYSSKYSLVDWSRSGNIPIGRPMPNIKLYIFDKYNCLQPPGIVGELTIGGVGLARGYLNRPELTADKFININHHSSFIIHHSILYRTGDLARWLPDGNIEFLGRTDSQVKIRGFRVELGEVETLLLKHDRIKETVVVTGNETGDKYLAAYFVSSIALSDTELREYLLKVLPDYMIPAYFIRLAKIPLTPTGKIDRRALPAPKVKEIAAYVAPRNEIEMKLAEIWVRILGRNLSSNRIGIDENFFQLGGHSLKVTSLASRIHKVFNVKIPLAEIFKRPTIRGLFDYINEAVGEHYVSIEPVEKKEYYKLSSAQKRLYLLHQIDKHATSYNISAVWSLQGVVDKNKLEDTFVRLVKRHESLRTSFLMIAGEAAQVIHEDAGFMIEYFKPGEVNIQKIIENFLRAFDLVGAPLIRACLIQIEEDKHILMIDMHHIISDGISVQILIQDFTSFYSGNELKEMKLQYKDYTDWQNREKGGENLVKQGEYWKKEFEEEIPMLDLPTDYNRPAVRSFEGSRINFEVRREIAEALETLTLETGTTLYIVLFALYSIFLAKVSNSEDIVIGSPVAGRRHADLERIIGMFVNTLAVRNYPSGEKKFTDFLVEVKESTLNAFENQDYQYENLVEEVLVTRDAGRNPLFDTMLALQNTDIRAIEIPGLKFAPYDYENKTSKFDLTLIGVRAEDTILFTFEYSTKLFKSETVERFIAYFVNIILGVVENRQERISHFEIITEQEKKRILFDFNDTKKDYPKDKTIHRLFEEQVEQTPDRIAIFSHGRTPTNTDNNMPMTITYRELNDQSDRLAGLLIEKGVLVDNIVAIMIERSIEMIIGIMGILKAGGAYLPIDLKYPTERVDYMLKDSGAQLLVTTSNKESEKVGRWEGERVLLNHLPFHHSSFIIHHSNHLAYIIYTSGSTGMPKGVMIEHRSVVNRLNWMQKAYPIDGRDVILQKTTFTFDVSVWELFWWSFRGACVSLLGTGEEKDPAAIADEVVNHRVTTMHFVPSMLNVFLDYLENEAGAEAAAKLRSLRQVFASGEALSPVHVERFYRLFGRRGARLINLYGPTEATVDVSYFDCVPGETYERIPIGKPIDNINLYVLDKSLHLQPVGVVGELHIGGVGLARGYLNRPDLTTEKFINKSFWKSRNLFSKRFLAAGGTLYRTGDLARWLNPAARGAYLIEFLGRIDSQVKIRGFRIELGEIENRLLAEPAVKEAVVMARTDPSGDNRLAAYVVPNEAVAFTVHRLLEIERNNLQGDRPHYELPNGMPVFYLNRNETDFMYREIFEERSYLRHGITLKEGSCIFDIGANIGIFSLFANQVCPDARIYSFEPVPALYDLLTFNTSLYGANFKIFKNGISSVEEEVVFTYYPHASILSGRFADEAEEKEAVKAFIHRELEAAGGDRPTEEQIDELLAERLSGVQFKCAMKTVSQVMRENSVERIDLLKIDVEKAELDVLEGIEAADWPKIQQLVLEVHDSGGRLSKIMDLLKKYGYKVAVEQDSMLEETALYNLYAIKNRETQAHEPGPQGEPAAAKVGRVEPGRYSPGRLIDELKESLRGLLPDYMIPSHFVLLDKMPLTASGKVDRKALPAPEVKRGEGYEAPTDEIEEKLVGIWSEVLGRQAVGGRSDIGVEDDFFHLGGHSLSASLIAAKIHKTFQVKLTLAEILEFPTITEQAVLIARAGQTTFIDLDISEQKEYYELSYNQKRLWLLCHLQDRSTSYNLPVRLELDHAVNEELLKKTLTRLVERHESLRTGFRTEGDEPVQYVVKKVEIPFEKFDLSALEERLKQGQRERILLREGSTPFNLECIPLFRAVLVKLTEIHYDLILNMHHIITDGWSVEILKNEFLQYYHSSRRGEIIEPEPLKVQYKDFAAWKNRQLADPTRKKQSGEFWMTKFREGVPVLQLPTAAKGDDSGCNSGDAYRLLLDEEMARHLRQRSRDSHITLFTHMFAAYLTLLHRLTKQPEVVCSIINAGRDHISLQSIVGFFVNSLLFKTTIDDGEPFDDFLKRLNRELMESFMHQDYPLELVFKELKMKYPDVPVSFNMLNIQDSSASVAKIDTHSAGEYRENTQDVKFDIELYVTPYQNGIELYWAYRQSLFETVDIEYMVSEYVKLLEFFKEQPRESNNGYDNFKKKKKLLIGRKS